MAISDANISNCKFICHKGNSSVFNLNFEQIPKENFLIKFTYSPVVKFHIYRKAIALTIFQSQINVKVKAKRVFCSNIHIYNVFAVYLMKNEPFMNCFGDIIQFS